MRGRSVIKTILLVVLSIIVIAVLGFVCLVVWLSATEYRPADVEALDIVGESSQTIAVGDSLTLMDWNIGYGALGDNADFFMDGGKMVMSASKQRVHENMDGIVGTIEKVAPDILFLQEIDKDSKRSHRIDERQMLVDTFAGYQSTYARNFKCEYVPYPLPTIGKVDSGIMTMSSYPMENANRIKLPSSFGWPVRMANLKRCLLINRVPIANSDKELVLINLHLEAYDEGEGKRVQTAFLKRVLEEEVQKGNYVIAGGDFNQTFSNADISAYPVTKEGLWTAGIIDVREFDESLQFIMDSTIPSCRSLDRPYEDADPKSFQYYLLDGFILSDNLQINSMDTLDTQFVYADHNPLVLSVTLLPEE